MEERVGGRGESASMCWGCRLPAAPAQRKMHHCRVLCAPPHLPPFPRVRTHSPTQVPRCRPVTPTLVFVVGDARELWCLYHSYIHNRYTNPPLQAHDINALFGFRLECLERLGDEQVSTTLTGGVGEVKGQRSMGGGRDWGRAVHAQHGPGSKGRASSRKELAVSRKACSTWPSYASHT